MQPSHSSDFLVFTGNANPALAAEIASHLNISLGAADVGRFSDGEVTVEIKQNVRARDVFVVQSTCAPTNGWCSRLLHKRTCQSAGALSAVAKVDTCACGTCAKTALPDPVILP